MSASRAPAGTRGAPAPASGAARYVSLDGAIFTREEWSERMLTLALRARADRLRDRLRAPLADDDRTIRRVMIEVAVSRARRSFDAIERAERSIHWMLDKPALFTIRDLENARESRAALIDEMHAWCDLARKISGKLSGEDSELCQWIEGYMHGGKAK